MGAEDVGRLLREAGALLEGHFLLSSGRHSAVYIEKFRILEKPDLTSRLCARIAEHYRDQQVELVAGPTTGGILLAFEVARQLGVEALYVEREAEGRALRRGAKVPSGARTLVVDDVLTTGLSLRETVEVLEKAGARIVGLAVLVDRSERDCGLGYPLFAVHREAVESYPPENVPEWLASRPLTRPGTRSGV